MTYNQIIIHLTKVPYIKSTCKKVAGDLADDLYQFIWLRLLEMPHDKIIQIYDVGYLQFYIYRMIINEARNKNNKFLKIHSSTGEQLIDDIQIETDDTGIEDKLKLIATKLDNLFWYDKKIFELYIEHGSLRKVEKQTGIKYGAINQTVQKVKKLIRDEANIINRTA